MTQRLECVHSSVSSETLCDLLERDGAVVVEDALTAGQLDRLNAEFEACVSATPPGIDLPDENMAAFFGQSTVRIDGLPAKSATFVEVMLTPRLLAVADRFLLPNCAHYLLNTGQLIQIEPGETVQPLHRDEDAWSFFPDPKPHLQVEAMYALSAFTAANGATRVVPGSHRWPRDREPRPPEIVQAEMPAGGALFYLGATLHGGGANRTRNAVRRGMFVGFVVGWLRTEENTFLSVPFEKVRAMPVRARQLLGYESHVAIGVVDVRSPMALFT